MKSRAARLALLVLFMVALGATAYLYSIGESLEASEARALRTFQSNSRIASRAVLDIRAAQQAYVAAGQGGEFWTSRVAKGVATLQAALSALRGVAAAPQAVAEMDAIGSTLEDFAQLDRRAREYARTGQSLIASDLIFSDGLEMMDGVSARLAAALDAEIAARDAASAAFGRRQIFALAAAAAASLLVVLLLFPRVEADAPLLLRSQEATVPNVGASRPAVAPKELDVEGWSPPRKADQPASPEPGEPRPVVEEPATPQAPALRPQEEGTDFVALASLCTDFARVVDIEELPSLLERASTLLDASGIVLWIADPDGRELNPIVAQGYSPQLLNRLGTIPRDAENATAAAFRTGLVQTVSGSDAFNGAIAAPLVTPGGCVGVVAAEVRKERERQDRTLAAAAIMAAQLAALVGPPSTRHTKVEAAGA